MAKSFGTIISVVPAVDVQDISSSVGLLGVRTATGSARQDSRDSSVLRGRGLPRSGSSAPVGMDGRVSPCFGARKS